MRRILLLCVFVGLAVGPAALAQAPGTQAPTAQASGTQTTGASLPAVVATVDDYEITRAEFLAHAQIVALQMSRSGQGQDIQRPGFLNMVLDALIGERLVYADLERDGKVVPESAVEQAIDAMAERYGGRAGLEESLKVKDTNLTHLRSQLRQTLTIEQVLTRDIAEQVRPSEEALRRLYASDPSLSAVPERHKVRQILKRLPADATQEQIEQLSAQLLALRQQVLDGADFAALARDHSEDERTREQGGEMPWVVVSRRSSDFERAAAALGTVGQLSDVVRSPVGLHILQLVDRIPPGRRSFEDMREQLSGLVTTMETKREVLRRIEGLKAQATIDIKI